MSNNTSTTTHTNEIAKDRSTHGSSTDARTTVEHRPTRRISTETKASPKTSELYAYIAAVVGVLVASALVDSSDFGPQEAWFYVTLLTIGYMVSRGLAKSGSRDYFDDNR